MPLITCPSCVDMAPMQAIQRNGIEIDVCTKCRGVWLDRGELDKLLAAVRQSEADEAPAAPPPRQSYQPEPPRPAPQPHQPYPPQSYGERGEYGEYGERGEGYNDPRYGYRKKKRFDIFDIFD